MTFITRQHQENSSRVDGRSDMSDGLTIVANFPMRSIFLPFFLTNFNDSETHQYFMYVTSQSEFSILTKVCRNPFDQCHFVVFLRYLLKISEGFY